MSETIKDLKKTPLYERHVGSGAKMVPFSGWNMPVQYTGIIEEHLHTRGKAGLFDICHMGEFMLSGPKAAEDVDRLVTCRTGDMTIGQCRYGFLLNGSGGVIDDLIVFRMADDKYMLVVNAGTIEKDKDWILAGISGETVFKDISEETAKIDVQGPLSAEILKEAAGGDITEGIKRFHFAKVDLQGTEIILSRTGYTGELGYELFIPVDECVKIWDMLIDVEGIKPVGLGARDTLRMEMGYSLYGNDIDEGRTPLEAGLDRFVDMGKEFIGKEGLSAQQEEGYSDILAGFVCEGRRSARSHFRVNCENNDVGEVTSGSFSPCLKKGIGLCYIDKKYSAAGQEIMLTDGRTEIKATVESLPLYKKQLR